MDSERVLFDRRNMLSLGNFDLVLQGTRSLMNIDEISRKRPFLNTPEIFVNQDYYFNKQMQEKNRRLTPEQVNLLEKSFEEENKLEPHRKIQLAKKLGVRPRQVTVWFQNRRARWKTEQLERDYDLLKSSYEALLCKHVSTLEENQKLKSQVDCLTVMLQPNEGTIEPIPTQNPKFPADKTTTYMSDAQFDLDLEGSPSHVFAAAEQQKEPFSWWVWS